MKVLLRSQVENELTKLDQKVQTFARQLADFMQIEVLNQQGQFRFFRRLLNYDEGRIAGRPQSTQFLDYQVVNSNIEAERNHLRVGDHLVLSSQRPSELSQTVLSQCNSFLLHRLSNDKDQEAVSKLLPDNLRGILRELPVLPTRYAFLLGWASELPILTEIRELAKSQQPESADPDFWAVWTGKDADGNEAKREVDWKTLAKGWQTADKPQQADELETISAEEQTDEISDEDIPF